MSGAGGPRGVTVVCMLLFTGTYEWGGWSTWSDCSVTCGTGLMYRKRVCLFTENRTMASNTPDQPLCAGETIIEDACTKAPWANGMLTLQLIYHYIEIKIYFWVI